MLYPFFALAFLSPGRQQAFRLLVVAHVLILGAALLVVLAGNAETRPVVGHALLVAGIVEGALLIGWRLTQLPKSQALEFISSARCGRGCSSPPNCSSASVGWRSSRSPGCRCCSRCTSKAFCTRSTWFCCW
jgi:hypothetical protein